MPQATAKAVHYTDVPAQTFGDEAPGVTIRWVIDEEHDGAPTTIAAHDRGGAGRPHAGSHPPV